MAKLYHYVGPEAIRKRVVGPPLARRVASAGDLLAWFRETGQEPNGEGLIPITFVIDEQGNLCVADHRSEPVACSMGQPVLSAGEMFLHRSGAGVEVSNQSTAFCPESASWAAVAAALDPAGISHPGRVTQEVHFRLCPACGQRWGVKDSWFVCCECGADLPASWNF